MLHPKAISNLHLGTDYTITFRSSQGSHYTDDRGGRLKIAVK